VFLVEKKNSFLQKEARSLFELLLKVDADFPFIAYLALIFMKELNKQGTSLVLTCKDLFIRYLPRRTNWDLIKMLSCYVANFAYSEELDELAEVFEDRLEMLYFLDTPPSDLTILQQIFAAYMHLFTKTRRLVIPAGFLMHLADHPSLYFKDEQKSWEAVAFFWYTEAVDHRNLGAVEDVLDSSLEADKRMFFLSLLILENLSHEEELCAGQHKLSSVTSRNALYQKVKSYYQKSFRGW
jgi:hypothetical protein